MVHPLFRFQLNVVRGEPLIVGADELLGIQPCPAGQASETGEIGGSERLRTNRLWLADGVSDLGREEPDGEKRPCEKPLGSEAQS